MKTKRIILFLAAAALFTGCFKDVSYKTTYVFKPLEQEKSGDPTQILADAKLYAFAADTSSWEVASYKDALAGVISQRGNRNEKISTPLAAGEPYEQEGVEGLLQMSFDRSSVMVVAVDTKNELYGYTQQEVPENTPKIYVTLIFKRWKQGYSYKDGKWLMFNDSYTPPIYIDSHVTAQLQAEEGAEPTVPSNLRVTPMPSIRPHGRSTLTTMRRSGSLPRRAIPSRRGPAPISKPITPRSREPTA